MPRKKFEFVIQNQGRGKMHQMKQEFYFQSKIRILQDTKKLFLMNNQIAYVSQWNRHLEVTLLNKLKFNSQTYLN
ncbi:unnamed protein product [Paramecium primaurelia]|uniref:Uncharacterized protein n=1 Tax=Paramecium primaurelia TaxID=5886 RepID=A0A8S1LJC5_PARPR|nr:unnamed protein product [Paramecium primaurelia]